MHLPTFQIGDRVVFSATKRSSRPGPRAKDVRPEKSGEGYQYQVNKFWVVREVREDAVIVLTRRGKTHVLSANDPALRRAGLWERIALKSRFPEVPAPPEGRPA